MSYEYDVAVLGAGPGGYEAAIRCAQYGLATTLIEARELGGTCLNRGCIPTKALLHGAEVYETIGDARSVGVTVDGYALDFAKLAAYKDKQVTILRRGVEGLEKAYDVTVVSGFGVLRDAHTIMVGEQEITAKNIIIATGSAPSVPPIPGAEHAMTSDDVLSMKELPESVVIVGGGVIGIEFATLFATLGKKVTVLEMLPDILPGVDERITTAIRAKLKRKKVDIVNEAKVTGITADGTVAYELNGEAKTVQAEKCMICVGRKPMTANIGLEALGVQMERGYICVGEDMRTSVENLYAIGDITGKIQLAHVATAQGMVAAASCAGKPAKMAYDAVPACIYTNPEIAYIGLTEQRAVELGHNVRVGRAEVAANGRATVMNERTGMCLLVCDADTGKILGAQMMAPRATDMIAEIAAVMRCGGTAAELSDTIHPHPTVSEIIMEAAHDVEGLSCHAMPKAAE